MSKYISIGGVDNIKELNPDHINLITINMGSKLSKEDVEKQCKKIEDKIKKVDSTCKVIVLGQVECEY